MESFSLLVTFVPHAFTILLFAIVTKKILVWFHDRTNNQITQREREPEALDGGKTPTQVAEPSLESAWWDINPCQDFDLATAPPLQLRPYKPRFYMTMATTNVANSELITLDREFLKRLQLRWEILEQHPESTVEATPVADLAVRELYDYLAGYYLPKRFPTVFRTYQSGEQGRPQLQLQNVASGALYPARALANNSATDILRDLATLVDEDFIILMPPQTCEGNTEKTHEDEYTVQAWAVCYVSGFALPPLKGKPLSFVHSKVPGFQDKLALSMKRWFSRLEVGRLARRCNWTITMHGSYRNNPGENQLYEDEDEGRSLHQKERENIDLTNAHLRTELQHLYRLPSSRAIVFTYKTYLYPLADIKAEGQGEALADAVEGLSKGNVPEMARYKRSKIWGEAVCNFLRS